MHRDVFLEDWASKKGAHLAKAVFVSEIIRFQLPKYKSLSMRSTHFDRVDCLILVHGRCHCSKRSCGRYTVLFASINSILPITNVYIAQIGAIWSNLWRKSYYIHVSGRDNICRRKDGVSIESSRKPLTDLTFSKAQKFEGISEALCPAGKTAIFVPANSHCKTI